MQEGGRQGSRMPEEDVKKVADPILEHWTSEREEVRLDRDKGFIRMRVEEVLR